MRNLKTIIVASAATLALIGTAAFATQPARQASAVHEMTVQLPGGGVEHITYTGDFKPTVVIAPDGAFGAPFFAAGPSFAGFDRIAAQMDAVQAQMNAQMNAMLRQAHTMMLAMPNTNAPMAASFGGVPAGASSYSFVSTSSGTGFCSRMVEVTTDAAGKQHMTQKTSGDCGAQAKPSSAPVPKSAI